MRSARTGSRCPATCAAGSSAESCHRPPRLCAPRRAIRSATRRRRLARSHNMERSVNERLGPIVGLVDITTNLYVKALAGVSREAFLARPGGKTNSLGWIAGHLVQSRARMHKLARSEERRVGKACRERRAE